MAVFVDSSVVIGLAFGEPATRSLARILSSTARVSASTLLEAEVLACFTRERVDRKLAQPILDRLTWVAPSRSLGDEIAQVLTAGYLKGADVWHLAVALYLYGRSPGTFLTADVAQREVARRLGFKTDLR